MNYGRPIGGAIVGATVVAGWKYLKREDPIVAAWHARRKLLPKRVILVRHGESEGNADLTLYRTKGDNLIELTAAGSEQAVEVGKRIKKVIGDEKVLLQVSPFQRTIQTARNARVAFNEQVVRTHIDSRIREQEFGNLQGEDFKTFREQQQKVGRFFYRFPTGESGADVFDRTQLWWSDEIAQVNHNPNHPHCDIVIVFTHGLTMRLILMQLYKWTPNTFETVWNAGNCEMYVLKKDLSSSKTFPYFLCAEEGDMPPSTAHLLLKLVGGEIRHIQLRDYLSVPQPRTIQHEFVKQMIQKQHGIDPAPIEFIDFHGGKFKKYR